MDVIDQWSGGHAAALQAAMRATNEEFARCLGVAVRTVASWHSAPATVPRREIQRALDGLHERATPAERNRFTAILQPDAVHCSVRKHLGTRVHPVTGVLASYEFCEYLAGDARNADPVENLDTSWVPIGSLTKFIPTEQIYPPVLAALEALA